jgi:hypothetical protein
MTRILANAVVDVALDPTPMRLGRFRVECWGKPSPRAGCWGEPPSDYVRIYTIQAKSDTLAAQEGLRRFVEEIEDLLGKQEQA